MSEDLVFSDDEEAEEHSNRLNTVEKAVGNAISKENQPVREIERFGMLGFLDAGKRQKAPVPRLDVLRFSFAPSYPNEPTSETISYHQTVFKKEPCTSHFGFFGARGSGFCKLEVIDRRELLSRRESLLRSVSESNQRTRKTLSPFRCTNGEAQKRRSSPLLTRRSKRIRLDDEDDADSSTTFAERNRIDEKFDDDWDVPLSVLRQRFANGT